MQLPENRLKAVFEQSPLGIQVCSANGDSLWANRAWEQLWDSPRDQLEGSNLLKDPQVKAMGLQTDFERALNGETVSLPATYFDPGQIGQRGRARWVKTVMYPITDASGTVQEVVITHEDVTERRQAEEALRERTEQLTSIYDTVADVIFDLEVGNDGQFRFVSVNQAFLATTGLTIDQVVGKRVEEVIPEPSLSMVLEKYREAIGKKKVVRWEETSDFATGRLTGEVSIAPLFNSAGQCTHLIGGVHDITERKRSEANIRQYADIVENMQIGLYVFHLEDPNDDRSLRLVSANSAALEFSGTTSEEVIGKTLDEGFPDLREQGIPQKYAEVIRTQKAVELEVVYYDDSQSLDTAFAVKAFPLSNNHLGVAFESITERRRTEHELNRRAHEFAALHEITKDLSSELDVAKLLETIVARTNILLGSSGGFIYLYDSVQDELVLTNATEIGVPIGTRLKIGEGMAGKVAATRQSLIIDDYQAWQGKAEAFQDLPFHSIVEVPMIYGGELVGILGVEIYDDPTRKFDENDARLLSLFAGYAAIAVRNARLLNETNIHSRNLTLLYEAGLALNRELNPRSQVRAFFEIILRGLKAENAVFFRYNEVSGDLHFESGVGGNLDLEGLKQVRFPVGEARGLVGWVAKNRQPLYVADVQTDPRWIKMGPELRSVLWTPVEFENRLLGVLTVASMEVNAFSKQDEQLLDLFANQISISMENARLFDVLRDELLERRQVEQSLRESEQRFRNLFENSPLAIWEEDFSEVKTLLEDLKREGVADLDAYLGEHPEVISECLRLVKVLDVNQAALKLYEARNKLELLGNLDKTFPTDSLPGFKNELLLIAKGTLEYQSESTVYSLLGNRRIVSLNWAVVPGNEQSYSKVLVSLIDVTERKQAEEKLRQSEKRFRALIENSSEEVSLLAADGSLLYESPSVNPTLGYAPGEFLGQNLFQLVHPDDIERVQTLFTGLAQKPGSNLRDQFRLRHNSGEWRWVEAVGANLLNEPAVQAIVVNYHDITERREAEEKLRDSEEKLRNIIKHSSSMFYTHTPDHVLTYVSPQSREILDCEPEEAQIRWQEFLSDNPANRQGVETTERAIRTRERQPTYELELVTRLGRKIWVQVDESPVVSNGKTIAVVGSLTDITARRQAENALQTSEQRYRALFEESPVSIWEEDFSQVREYFEELRTRGVTDFRNYFEEHPEAVLECIRLVQVVDVNRATLALMQVKDKSELLTALSESLSEDALPTVATELVSLAEGNLSYESDEIFRNRLGEKRHVFFRLTVAPGYEETLGRVFVSIVDVTERRRTERALRESEQRYSLATKATNDVIWEWNLETNELIWNENAFSVFGYQPEEVYPHEKWWEELMHPQDRERVLAKLDASLASGDSIWSDEYRFLRRDGLYADIVDRGYVERDAQGKGLRMIGAMSDITLRRRAEVAVEESEQRYRGVFENTPVAIWEEDFSEVKRYVDALKQDGIADLRAYFRGNPAALRECMDLIRVLDVNSTAVEMYEANGKEDLIQSSMSEPGTGEFEHNPEDFAAIAEGVTHFTWEGEDKTLKGKPIIVNLTWSVMPGHEADYSKVLVTTVDITERRRAETALRHSQEQLLSLIEQAPISIALLDREMRYIVTSHRWVKEFGRGFDNLVGRGHYEINPDLPDHWKEVHRRGLAGETLNNDSDRWVQSDGAEQWLRWAVLPWRDVQGEIGGIIISAEDITARIQAETRLRESQLRLSLFFNQSLDGFFFSMLEQPIEWNDTADKEKLIDYVLEHQRITEANDAMIAQYGATRDTFIGRTPSRFFAHDPEQARRFRRKLFDAGRLHIETQERKDDGTPVWIEGDYVCMYDSQGRITGMFGIQRDITERKLTENQLRESEERFHQLSDNIEEVFWITDPVRNHDLYLSPAYEKVWGRPAKDQLQNTRLFIETVLPEDRPFVKEMLARQVGGEKTAMEYRIMRPDGSIRWIGDRAFPIFDESRKVRLVTGIAADITERKQAETETLRHLAELQALYENGLAVGRLLSPREIGERVIQTFTQYLSWHHVAIRLRKGESDELEVVAFNVPHLKEEERRDVEQNFTARINKVGQGMSGWVVQTGEPIRTGRVKEYPQYVNTYEAIESGMYMPLKVGDQIIGSISVESELPDAFTEQDERLLATLASQAAVAFENARLYQAIQQELSERIRAEEMLEQERNSLAKRVEERTAELRAANSNLARALRVKDEFLANMSHELRTPLNAILGLSESLGEQVAGPLNEKQGKYVQTITESGHHLLALINDILDLAKIEAGQVTLDIAKVDVHSLCESSLRMVRQLAQQKDQNISLEIDEKVHLIWGDERRLKQMIVNLLSNAVKFTPEGGNAGLEVNGDEDENRVLITVWDSGIGIVDQDISKLFQPFVQLSTGLARETTGTGLGLALVAQMARLHGGGVSVSSLPGEGSRFTLVLPWEPALAVDTVERMKVTGKFRAIRNLAEHERRTILLIEDTAEVVMMVRDYLESTGFNVATAGDGLEGLAQAKRVRPDLILMDLQMPRMDGFETTRNLRSDPDFKTTPIIALTALAMQGDRERCLAAGMDEYITKPVNLRALVKIIEACLTSNDG